MKVMTIRQSDELAEELEFVATIDGVPVAEVVRRAITVHLAARQAAPDFQTRLQQHIRKMESRTKNQNTEESS